jgi:hypothetical protein
MSGSASWTTAASPEEADLGLLGTPSVAPLADGSALYLDLDVPVVGGPGTVDLSGRLWLQGTATADRSVVFGLDLSGSAAVPGQGCGGDFNHDGLVDPVMDCEFVATLDAAPQMAPRSMLEITGGWRDPSMESEDWLPPRVIVGLAVVLEVLLLPVLVAAISSAPSLTCRTERRYSKLGSTS